MRNFNSRCVLRFFKILLMENSSKYYIITCAKVTEIVINELAKLIEIYFI